MGERTDFTRTEIVSTKDNKPFINNNCVFSYKFLFYRNKEKGS